MASQPILISHVKLGSNPALGFCRLISKTPSLTVLCTHLNCGSGSRFFLSSALSLAVRIIIVDLHEHALKELAHRASCGGTASILSPLTSSLRCSIESREAVALTPLTRSSARSENSKLRLATAAVDEFDVFAAGQPSVVSQVACEMGGAPVHEWAQPGGILTGWWRNVYPPAQFLERNVAVRKLQHGLLLRAHAIASSPVAYVHAVWRQAHTIETIHGLLVANEKPVSPKHSCRAILWALNGHVATKRVQFAAWALDATPALPGC